MEPPYGLSPNGILTHVLLTFRSRFANGLLTFYSRFYPDDVILTVFNRKIFTHIMQYYKMITRYDIDCINATPSASFCKTLVIQHYAVLQNDYTILISLHKRTHILTLVAFKQHGNNSTIQQQGYNLLQILFIFIV